MSSIAPIPAWARRPMPSLSGGRCSRTRPTIRSMRNVTIARGRLLNESTDWLLYSGGLNAVPDRTTDSWRDARYGSTRQRGPFSHCATIGDFTADLSGQARHDELCDQAGIMVRLDKAHWVK